MLHFRKIFVDFVGMVLIVVGLWTLNGLAQDVVPIVQIGTAYGMRGDYVDVPVFLEETPELDNFGFIVWGQTISLEFVRFKLEGTLLEHFESVTVKDELGMLTIEAKAGSAPPITTTGTLIILRFRINDIALTEAEVTNFGQGGWGDFAKAEIADGWVYLGSPPEPTDTPKPTVTPTSTPEILQPTPTPLSATPTPQPPTPTTPPVAPQPIFINPLLYPSVSANDILEIRGTFAGLASGNTEINNNPPAGREIFNAEGSALRCDLDPGEGSLLIFANKSPIPIKSVALIRALIWVSNSSASVFVGGIDVDSENHLLQDIGVESVYNSQSIHYQWKWVCALHYSQSGFIKPLVQMVGGNNACIVYVDNIEVYDIQQGVNYPGDLFGAGEG